jgi:glycosyltransferase involved in cell wall biosynthesis
MRIGIVSSILPFVRGGGRFIVDWLAEMMTRRGIEVERVLLPFWGEPATTLAQMTAYRLIDLSESMDRIITIRPPAHVLPHPDKRVWFIHHLRQFYDLWDTDYYRLSEAVRDLPAIRDNLFRADTNALLEARAVYTNSRRVADRLRRFNNIDATVLYPPLFEPERFRFRGLSDTIVYVCRVERHKRQHLAVEAMRYCRTPVRLMIVGEGQSASYARELSDSIGRSGLEDRVKYEPGWITEEKKTALFADCLAALYIPFEEDSYGYPSLEAHHSEKAVVTMRDSGGTLELIVDGRNGLVTDPEPRALAEALDRLYADRQATRAMGREGLARIAELNITWDRVIEAFAS